MFLQRSALAATRRVAVGSMATRRSFATTMLRREAKAAPAAEPAQSTDRQVKTHKTLSEIQSFEDLYGPGAQTGSVPTDLEQATGLERLEILGKMEGVDIFDMRPLDASRKGTMDNPILVRSAGNEQFVGCTGSPADSHVTNWVGMDRKRPVERCNECGSVYKMVYVGPEEDHHGHDHGHHQQYEAPKTFADYIKPEYYYR